MRYAALLLLFAIFWVSQSGVGRLGLINGSSWRHQADRAIVWAAGAKSEALDEISAIKLAELLEREDVLLLDVRTPEEYAVDHIQDALLVPLSTLQKGDGVAKVAAALNDRALVVYCTRGVRSARALATLEEAGIKGVNLTGGIVAWSEDIDPSVKPY